MKSSDKSSYEYSGYKIYHLWLDSEGWTVDGEIGIIKYPAEWTEELVRYSYEHGLDPVSAQSGFQRIH